MRNFFSNVQIGNVAEADRAVNTFVGGTLTPIYAGDHDYHEVLFVGTLGNVGTLWAYGATNAAGSGLAVLGSLPFGSSDLGAANIGIRTDTLTGLGTAYAYLAAGVSVAAGGTLTGALFIASHHPRTAGTAPAALGYAAVGSSLV